MYNLEDMEYNTGRNQLIMREYGRHIQKMIEYLLTIEDKDLRQKNAYAVIELMGFLNPHLKNVEDFRHKLWDHLFLISDFKLDVESPYPIPTRESLRSKPKPLPYPKRYPKFAHLGKNLEIVINKALKEENPEKKQGFANAVAYYMKLAYTNWHKETGARRRHPERIVEHHRWPACLHQHAVRENAENKRRQRTTKEETSTISATSAIRNFNLAVGTTEMIAMTVTIEMTGMTALVVAEENLEITIRKDSNNFSTPGKKLNYKP